MLEAKNLCTSDWDTEESRRREEERVDGARECVCICRHVQEEQEGGDCSSVFTESFGKCRSCIHLLDKGKFFMGIVHVLFMFMQPE